jgi:hypothetical protein
MQINLGTSLSSLRQPIVAGDPLPTQWSDFVAPTVLPPSYVLVDQDDGSDPHDYTAEGSENVRFADDGLEVSTSTSEQNTLVYPVLAGWSEAKGTSALPSSSQVNGFTTADVSNSSDIGFSVGQSYGEITASNTFDASGVEYLRFRAKYSGTAPANVFYEIQYNQRSSSITDDTITSQLTTSYQDFAIPFTLSPSLIDSQGGFFFRIRYFLAFGGTTNLHVDRIVLSK